MYVKKTPALYHCITAAISGGNAHVAGGKGYGEVRLTAIICFALRSARRHVQFLSRTCQVVASHPVNIRTSLGTDARI